MEVYKMLFPLDTTEILIATIVFFFSYSFIGYFENTKKKLPRGPLGFPIVGCLPYIKKDPHLRLMEMASKYGDVFSMYLGSQFVVILNGVDTIKEGMNKSEFLGRPNQSAFSIFENLRKSILFSNGKDFHDQRKFMLHSMRDLGLGKTVMEECMKAELEYFIQAIEDTKGQPYDVRTVLFPSMSNNITALIYGTRYDYEDPRRKLLTNSIRTVQEFLGQTAVHVFFPWTTKIPFIKNYYGYKRAYDAFMKFILFARSQIAEHKKTLDSNHTRDYIDTFLLEMQKTQEKKLSNMSFTADHLEGNIPVLMGAGTETVNTTLNWCLLLMAAYQDVQKKVQDEINTVIGTEKMPAWADQRHMPYTQAVIMEIMRMKTNLPLNLLRCTFEDTTFKGYDIPKGTIILANLWSAHYDPKYWKEPEKFKPERFLSADRQTVIKSEAYMPFSIGKRSCPGETMAVVEVFIYFTTILQRFDISLPKGVVPDLEGELTITYQIKPQDLCFVSRSSE